MALEVHIRSVDRNWDWILNNSNASYQIYSIPISCVANTLGCLENSISKYQFLVYPTDGFHSRACHALAKQKIQTNERRSECLSIQRLRNIAVMHIQSVDKNWDWILDPKTSGSNIYIILEM